MARIGIRVQDLFDDDVLRAKVTGALNLKNQTLVKIYNRKGFDVDAVVAELVGYRDRLRRWSPTPGCCSTRCCARAGRSSSRRARRRCSTSTTARTRSSRQSNATAGGACTGSGIPPTRISRVIAVVKAYTTRVGEGPFPTELLDAKGEILRNNGAEFGTTTGRPRRCGWFDAPIARYADRINGVTDFVLTKLDVLTGMDEVPVCVAYDVDGVRHDEVPTTRPSSRGPSRSTRRSRAGPRTSARRAPWTTCRATHATT